MSQIPQLLSTAVDLHKAGRLTEAEQGYRRILAQDPRQPDALHLLGLIAHQQGRHEAAVETIGRAVALNPNVALFHSNLALAQRELGRLADALASCRSAVRLEPGLATAHYNLGCILSEQLENDEAVRCFQRTLQILPTHVNARKCLGDVLVDQGRLDEATDQYRQALALDPHCAAAHFGLGNISVKRGRPEEAVVHYHQAVSCKPDYAEAFDNLGNALAATYQFGEAVNAYRRALQCNPALPDAHNNLGAALTSLGQLDEAMGHFRQALSLRPNYAEAHNNLGNVLKDRGQFPEALAAYNAAIRARANFAEPYANKAECRRYSAADRDEINQTEQVVADPQLSPDEKSCLHFALGKMYDDCGEWDRAFAHFRQGNELRSVQYDGSAMAGYIDALIETFDESLMDRVGRLGNPSELPVFIVGMPRSATTLIEQILASHPTVHGAGELRYLPELIGAMPAMLDTPDSYPRCAPALTEDTAQRLAQRYLRRIAESSGGALRVTDKMPHNFMHLGLIALLMPRAKIIHCRRDRMDVCLSCYFQNFHQPVPYAYDLEDIGTFWRLYARLMEHWRQVLPIPMLEVDYEELTENQEDVSRRMIEYLGLTWHPDCLNFQANPRPIQTASKWQVRQPLYRRAVGRWRNYEAHLDPLRRALG